MHPIERFQAVHMNMKFNENLDYMSCSIMKSWVWVETTHGNRVYMRSTWYVFLSLTSHSHVTHTPHTKVQSGKTYTWGVSVIPMRSEKAVKKKKRKRSGKSKVSNKKKHSRVETTNDDEAMAMRREALRVRNEGLL